MDLMLPSHAWKKPGKKIIKKRPKKMSLDELMRYESDEDEDEDEKEKDAFGSLYSMTQSFLTTGALGKVSAVPVAPVIPPPGRCTFNVPYRYVDIYDIPSNMPSDISLSPIYITYMIYPLTCPLKCPFTNLLTLSVCFFSYL